MANKGLKISAIILGVIAVTGLLLVTTNEDIREDIEVRKEQKAYDRIINSEDTYKMQQYLDKYPYAPGAHRRRVQSKLDTIKRERLAAEEEKDYQAALYRDTESAWSDFLDKHSDGKYSNEARQRLKWYTNRLSNGAQPYARWYGNNRSCDEWGCSQINVTAPTSSDVVVLIKKNNANGKTVRHAYIRYGATYAFEIPNGTYQVFFYYGSGWNPEKPMSGGIKGGFIKNEVFSKDDPQYLNNNVLSYVLQLQQNGNFSTKRSSESEMF